MIYKSFRVAGNGDCFYNSLALCFISEYQRNTLRPLLQNPAAVKCLLECARAVGLVDFLPGDTPELLHRGLQALFTPYLSKEADWRLFQEKMAQLLREFVVLQIETEERVQSEVRKDLEQALAQSVEIYPSVNSWFEDREFSEEKIALLLGERSPLSPAEKKVALHKWFFEEGGMQDYLRSEKGGLIAPRTFAGHLEAKVLSLVFPLYVAIYSEDAQRNLLLHCLISEYQEKREEENAERGKLNLAEELERAQSKEALVFRLKHTYFPAHWDPLLPLTLLSLSKKPSALAWWSLFFVCAGIIVAASWCFFPLLLGSVKLLLGIGALSMVIAYLLTEELLPSTEDKPLLEFLALKRASTISVSDSSISSSLESLYSFQEVRERRVLTKSVSSPFLHEKSFENIPLSDSEEECFSPPSSDSEVPSSPSLCEYGFIRKNNTLLLMFGTDEKNSESSRKKRIGRVRTVPRSMKLAGK